MAMTSGNVATETNGSGARPEREPWSSPGNGERSRIGVMLVHGFTGSPVSLRPLAELLAKRGFSVELPRLPGHGTTWREMIPTRYDDWRAEVVRKAKELGSRTERVVLVGLSMGGTLALDVASSGDIEPAGVVTINAQILDRKGIVVKLGPWLEKIFPVVPAKAAGLRSNDIAKPGVGEAAYGWVPSAAGNSLLRALPRVRAQVEKLTCPVLIAYSRQDHSVSPENSKRLLGLVRSSDLTELVLERSYHVATLDYDLELIEERVTAFADRVGALR
jgi:carboxylesterase